jgi:hypothetical protein
VTLKTLCSWWTGGEPRRGHLISTFEANGREWGAVQSSDGTAAPEVVPLEKITHGLEPDPRWGPERTDMLRKVAQRTILEDAKRRRNRDGKVLELEQKVAAQKRHITRIEECRRFELETQHVLVGALVVIREHPPSSGRFAYDIAGDVLADYAKRLGPRPTEVTDASSPTRQGE